MPPPSLDACLALSNGLVSLTFSSSNSGFFFAQLKDNIIKEKQLKKIKFDDKNQIIYDY